jgi:hypothetical protein
MSWIMSRSLLAKMAGLVAYDSISRLASRSTQTWARVRLKKPQIPMEHPILQGNQRSPLWGSLVLNGTLSGSSFAGIVIFVAYCQELGQSAN